MNFPPPTYAQARLIWFAITGLALALLVSLVVGLIWSLLQVVNILAPVLWPLAIAGVLAYLLDPVVDFLERKSVPRARAIILVFILALVIIVALFGSIVPRLVVETRELAMRVPSYVVRVQTRIENWINKPPDFLRKLLGPRKATAPPAGAVTNQAGEV